MSDYLHQSHGNWEVLVHDRLSPETDADAARWSTILSDGQKTSRLEGIVINNSGILNRLSVTHLEKKVTCQDGHFPFAYSVDELRTEPLGGSTSKVWLGHGALSLARSAMSMHLASCKDFAAQKSEHAGEDSYERTKLSFQGLYGRYVGVEEFTESLGYGQMEPVLIFDWSLYSLFSQGMTITDKRLLNEQETAMAREKYLSLPDHAITDPSYSQLLNYVLIPSGGGAAAEFAIPESTKPKVKIVHVRVEIERNLLHWYDQMRNRFVKTHPSLIPWDKVDFYTIAPDGQSVVYQKESQLYWQDLTSAPERLMDVHEVRGWQWHDTRNSTPDEEQED